MENDYNHKSRTTPAQSRRIDRREFLKRVGCAGTGLALSLMQQPLRAQGYDELPKRVLGRTKEKVTILGLGTAPVGEGPIGVTQGIKIFSEVIDRGENYTSIRRGFTAMPRKSSGISSRNGVTSSSW